MTGSSAVGREKHELKRFKNNTKKKEPRVKRTHTTVFAHLQAIELVLNGLLLPGGGTTQNTMNTMKTTHPNTHNDPNAHTDTDANKALF